jgi:hypothetical protein
MGRPTSACRAASGTGVTHRCAATVASVQRGSRQPRTVSPANRNAATQVACRWGWLRTSARVPSADRWKAWYPSVAITGCTSDSTTRPPGRVTRPSSTMAAVGSAKL